MKTKISIINFSWATGSLFFILFLTSLPTVSLNQLTLKQGERGGGNQLQVRTFTLASRIH